MRSFNTLMEYNYIVIKEDCVMHFLHHELYYQFFEVDLNDNGARHKLFCSFLVHPNQPKKIVLKF